MTRRSTRRGIILAALLAILSWLLARDQSEIVDAPLSELDTRLNYALHDFHGRLLNDQGDLHLELQAPLLQSNASTGIGTIHDPEIRIRQEAEQWTITAESAIISADRERVKLNGAVNLERVHDLTRERLDIQTRDVVLNVTPRTAASDAAVTIMQGGDRLDAVGLRIDMIREQFELLDEVRAHYETL